MLKRAPASSVLEAMKMEVMVSAPRAGLIERLLCAEGQSVREGETLLEMAERGVA